MAELVCPSGHQVVAVDGDGHDYEGHCDVCGLKLRVNKVNPVAAEYVHPNMRRDVAERGNNFEQALGAPPKAS